MDIKIDPRIIKMHKTLNGFKYGIQKDGKIDGIPSDEYFNKYYKTATPSEFEKQQGGVCWDFAAFQDDQLSKWGISHNTYYIETGHPKFQTHTFTIAKIDGMYVYMESSFGKIMGIYTASTRDAIINFVIEAMTTKSGHDRKSFEYIEVYEYNPKKYYHLTTKEFTTKILKERELTIAQSSNPKIEVYKESSIFDSIRIAF